MYANFSGPLDWSDEADDLIGFIATEHFRAVGQQFLERFAPILRLSSSGLVEFLAQTFEGDLKLNDVWRPSFGLAKRAVQNPHAPHDDPMAIATELALALAAVRCGRTKWSIALTRPAQFAVGRYAIPIATTADFQFQRGKITVERSQEAPLRFKNCAGCLEILDTGTAVERLPFLNDGIRQVLFASSSYFEDRHEDHLPFPVSDAGVSLEQAWANAYDLIRRSSDPYDRWVTGTVQSIIPVKAPAGSMVSGSQGHRPGEVYMTDLLEPIKLAEMLIHEASHQYFQIATFLGPVTNGADTELYYSPVVGTHRPLDKILLAYHAFANVILFLQTCRESSQGNPAFLETNLARLQREVEQLQEPLRSTSGLSDIGKGIWQPLAERLLHVH